MRQTATRKSIATQIAEHFGCDVADIRDYHYQPGVWSKRVYCGFDGNNYWSAGRSKPRDRSGNDGLVWTKVPSCFPGNADLWVGVVMPTESDFMAALGPCGK